MEKYTNRKKRILSFFMALLTAFLMIGVTQIASPTVAQAKVIEVKKLSVPKGFSVKLSGTTPKLVWKPVKNADGYQVYRKAAGCKWKKIGTLKGKNKTAYADATAKADTTYSYRVRATGDKVGEGTKAKGGKEKARVAKLKKKTIYGKFTAVQSGWLKKKWIVDQKAQIIYEPIYEYTSRLICNDCGADITENKLEHLKWEIMENGGTGSYHGREERVQTGTKKTVVPEKGHYEWSWQS